MGERELRDRPKKEEAREPKKLEVRCDYLPFQRNVVLTASRMGKGGKQLEREKKEKKAKKAPKEEILQPTDIVTAAPVRTEGIRSSSGGGTDGRPASSEFPLHFDELQGC